jgi:gamma-glutamylcysteine synthetase
LDDQLENALTLGGDEGELPGKEAQNQDHQQSDDQGYNDVIGRKMIGVSNLDTEPTEKSCQRLSDDFVEELDDK